MTKKYTPKQVAKMLEIIQAGEDTKKLLEDCGQFTDAQDKYEFPSQKKIDQLTAQIKAIKDKEKNSKILVGKQTKLIKYSKKKAEGYAEK